MATKSEIPGILVPRKTFIVHAGGRMVRFLKGQTTIVAGHPLVSGREHRFRPLTVDFDLASATAAAKAPKPAAAPAPPAIDLPDDLQAEADALAKANNRTALDELAIVAGIADPSTYDSKATLAAAIIALQTVTEPQPSRSRVRPRSRPATGAPQGSGDDPTTEQTPTVAPS